MSSWGFSMADLNTALNVLDAICDNPRLLEEPAIRATGIKQLINPAMLDRPLSPKQDFRVSGGAPIPGNAFKGGGTATKYGGAPTSGGAANGHAPTSNGHAYGASPGPGQAKYGASTPSSSSAPKYGASGGSGAPKYGGGGGGAAYSTEPKASHSTPAYGQSQPPRPATAGGAPKYGGVAAGPKYGAGAPEPAQPRYSAPEPQQHSQPRYASQPTPSSSASPPATATYNASAPKTVNLTNKLKQGRKDKDLSFSPKSPAEGYEHLW